MRLSEIYQCSDIQNPADDNLDAMFTKISR